jgi:hypothetical protein
MVAGADLRDPGLNDAAVHLRLGFGEAVHQFAGLQSPDTVACIPATVAIG